LPGAIDLALVVAAAVGMSMITSFCVRSYTQYHNYAGNTYPLNTFTRWSAQEKVLAVTLSWIVSISLMLLAVLRLAKLFTTGWRYLWTRYDIRETGEPIVNRASGTGRPAVDGPVYVLFGRKIWEAQLMYVFLIEMCRTN
jgi:hypothetical protein